MLGLCDRIKDLPAFFDPFACFMVSWFYGSIFRECTFESSIISSVLIFSVLVFVDLRLSLNCTSFDSKIAGKIVDEQK